MILVTGSKGFLGSRIATYLKDNGFDVLGTTQDVREIDLLRPHFKNIDFVIHAAGKKYNASPEEFFSINLLGTKNVADLCLENGSKLIYLGTAYRRGYYGDTKQRAQQLIEEYAKKGLKAVVLRMCSIIEEDRWYIMNNRVFKYPLKKLLEEIKTTIREHNFDNYLVVDYEKPVHIYQSGEQDGRIPH